jgi:tRNA (guanine-N7-)-methyltransferase
MGRRALRKIDQNLDLSRHLRRLDQLPLPWDATRLFGRDAPLEVDVGSGKGLFLVHAAKTHPEHNFLGIEVSRKYARFAAARLAQQGLINGCIACGDARRVLHEWLPDRSVAAVHIYFPDPWWKKRHQKRRVISEAFVQDVDRVLIPGSLLHLWTDVESYFSAALELIAETTVLEGPWDVPGQPAENDLDYRTHFERRMRLRGERVFRAAFRKP